MTEHQLSKNIQTKQLSSISCRKHRLNFINPAGTSRGILHTKDSYFLISGRQIGEASVIPNLSPDDTQFLDSIAGQESSISDLRNNASQNPALEFALEMLDIPIDSDFTEGRKSIPINGLVWMGEKDFMLEQIKTKIESNYRCIKIKIGAIDFEDEIELLRYIRSTYGPEDIQIRVDANGAFAPEEALEKLKILSDYALHSIEQPIRQGQVEEMAKLCKESPLDIALDEELISRRDVNKYDFLSRIMPQYIILKPSLVGGLKEADQWIEAAHKLKIGWWATSALESNVGLFHIAQWLAKKKLSEPVYQGLGTGTLYSNNIPSPLYLEDGHIKYNPEAVWDYSQIRS